MRDRIDRLKVYLLGSAVFLMLVIAAYIVHARFIARLHHLKLPASLGVDIVRESGGWTVCRSNGSRTLYCIHAVKVDQATSGKVALHDVSIVLYGKKGDRRDRIYGKDFEYDEKAGVVRAIGLVHIDLRAADSTENSPPTGETAGSEADKGLPEGSHAEALDPKLLHVTTSGLVYLEKLGVAATSDPIEFESGSITGNATGADYSSDSGMLLLHSSVSMSGVQGGHPVQLNASSAQFDGRNQQAYLTSAKYSSDGRTAYADQATLYRRTNGTLERVQAQGNVAVRSSGGAMTSQGADVRLNARSQAETVLLSGGVLYTDNQPLRQARGQAREATIEFDQEAKPQPEHAVFTGGVHMIERTRTSENGRDPWSVRDLTAEKFEAEMGPAKNGNIQLHNAQATGSAHLTVVSNGNLESTNAEQKTELAADDLRAVMSTSSAKPQLDTIAGRGHTMLHQVTAAGVDQTSIGDTLDAKFRPVPGKRPTGNTINRKVAGPEAEFGVDQLWTSVQQGHVSIARRLPAKKAGGRADVQGAIADRAAFDGDSDRLTLTGGVRLTDAGSVVWANEVALDRATGDAHAVGAVKVNYDSAQEAAEQKTAAADSKPRQFEEPTHILADRGDMERTTDTAIFYGKPVRLWQGGSQIQAPRIELSRTQKRLVAGGEGAGPQVHTVLASTANDGVGDGSPSTPAVARCATVAKPGSGKASPSPQTAASQVVRIASGGLTYSGATRQADFSGGVRADTADGTIRATQATGYLQQGTIPQEAASGTVPSLTGRLERVVATGNVDLAKPGLDATGDRLVYTASDRVFLLSGNQDAAAKAVDTQGTTTAAALRLRDSCDAGGGVSVEALGESPGVAPQRVRTEARISSERKREKAKQ